MTRHSHADDSGWPGLVFLAIIALLVYTWPYSLWLTLAACCGIGLYLLYRVRDNLYRAFFTGSNEGTLSDLRGAAAVACLVLAGIGAGVCVFSFSSTGLIYYVTAEAFLLTAWLHLQMLRSENPQPRSAALSLLQFPAGPTKTEEGPVKRHALAYHFTGAHGIFASRPPWSLCFFCDRYDLSGSNPIGRNDPAGAPQL